MRWLLLCTATAVCMASVTVRVVVRDSTGEPVVGARVLLERSHWGGYTDQTGQLELRNVAAGQYRLRVSAMGFAAFVQELRLVRDTVVVVVLQGQPLELAPVQVEAQRSPIEQGIQPVMNIGVRELDQHRGQTVAGLLERLPGTAALTTGPAIAKPVVRGFVGERLLVLSDELPIQGQQWGAEHAPELDPMLVEQVELLRGAAVVQYGPEAIGGVLRFRPLPLPRESGRRLELRLEGASASRMGALGIWTEGRERFAPLSWRLLVSARRSGDVATPRYWLANTAAQQLNGDGAVGYLWESGQARLRAQLYDAQIGVFAGMHIGNLSDLERAFSAPVPLVQRPFSYAIEPPFQHVQHRLLEVSAEQQIAAMSWRFLLGWQQNHRREYDRHYGSRPAYDVTLTTWSLRSQLQWVAAAGTFTLIAEAQRQGNVSSGAERLLPNFRAYRAGLALQGTWLPQPWELQLGVRVDGAWLQIWRPTLQGWSSARHHWAGVAAFAAIARHWREQTLRWSLVRGWRPPSPVELYAYGVHHGAATFEIGNPELAPEQFWMGELDYGFHSGAWHVDIAAFVYAFPSFIQQVPAPPPTLTIRGAFPTFRYEAIPALLAGSDVLLQWELAPRLRVEAVGTVLWGRQQHGGADTVATLYALPAPRAELRAHWHPPQLWKLEAPFVEPRVTLVARSATTPRDYAPAPKGYAIAALTLGTELNTAAGHFLLSLEVRNLFNRAYRDYLSRLRYFADEPGRDVQVRLVYRLR
jgi:iron complex outermembrane receptor protein